MTVFYTASYKGKERYQKYFDLLLEALKESKVAIVSPELGNYRDVLTKQDLKTLTTDPERHYAAINKGIKLADAVVIEVSNEDFQLGHEATLAIQNKKHVLCLSIYEDFSQKIRHRYFHGAKYNEYTVAEIIESFINLASRSLLTERFNLFLSPAQMQYLTEIAKHHQKPMSELIRDLIDEKRSSALLRQGS